MARYFFDLHTSGAIHVDDTGDILPGDDAARDCAWDVIVEHLRSARVRESENISVTVRDAGGPVFNARMSLVLEGGGREPAELTQAIRRLSTER